MGFRVGKDSDVKYLVLQVHYSSLDHIPVDGDDSGIFLEFSYKPMPKVAKINLAHSVATPHLLITFVQVAGVLLLGTGGLAPPHSTTFFETACEIEDNRPIHPFAFRTHTHSLGQ